MNLSQIRQEVQDRGFDFDAAARIDRWINRAYQRINDRHAWPFLETTTTGAAPLTISDIRNVLSVIDTTNELPLEWEDQRSIRERDPTLNNSGNPESWYLDGSQLKVYPANTTNSLSVIYLKVPAELTADADTPIFAARYHYVLVDGAVSFAYKDTDNFEAWDAMKAEFEEGLQEMANILLVPNYDTPAEITPSFFGSTDWSGW